MKDLCTRITSCCAIFLLLSAPGAVPLPLITERVPASPAARPAPTEGSAHAQARPDAKVVLTCRGVTLEVPAGAVTKPVELSIERLERIVPLAPGMENATAGAAGFRLLPHGQKFRRPVVLRIPYDRAAYTVPELTNLCTYYYDEDSSGWRKLARVEVDRQAGTVVSLTDHFSDFVNSVLTLPQSPNPLQFNPTSIKEIQAADPAARIPDPAGPEASAFGAARFSIPLDLPPGRQGMAPRIELSYNSDGSSGVAGRGFEIAESSIEIDTRLHLPAYDGNEAYRIDGEALVEVAGSGEGTHYRLSREVRRKRIIRYGSCPQDYWWEVTDAGGNRSVYGHTADSVAPGGTQRNIFRWHLSREIDPNGNTVDYRYAAAPGENFIYLSSIRYTGTLSDGPGPFSVEFRYDKNGRADKHYDARGGFLSHLTWRLDRIDIAYRDQPLPVRSYTFSYKTNLFGQSLLTEFGEVCGDGPPLWTYRFNYFEPETEGDGYAGFGSVRKMSTTAPELARTTRVSGSGDLYLGIGIAYALSIGGSVGVRGQTSWDDCTFADLSGDGLPDLVERSGGGLRYRENLGGAFASSPTEVIFDDGHAGTLNRSSQNSFSYGFSAGMPGAGSSWSQSIDYSDRSTGFLDINGDGRPDFVDGNQPSGFFANHGSGRFSPVEWSKADLQAASPLQSESPENQDQLFVAFHLLDAVRQWKAFRSGSVTVEATASIPKVEGDGARLLITKEADPLGPASAFPSFRAIEPGAASLHIPQTAVDLLRGDSLYFRINAANDIAGDEVSFNARIRYRTIRLFEDLPVYDTGWLPGVINLERYTELCDAIGSSSATAMVDDDTGLYRRTAGPGGGPLWIRTGTPAPVPVKQLLAGHGYFFPERIRRSDYATAFKEWLTAEHPTAPDDAKDEKMLLQAYRWVPGTDYYQRSVDWVPSDEELWQLHDIFAQHHLSNSCIEYSYAGTSAPIERAAEGWCFVTESASAQTSSAVIFASPEQCVPGQRAADRILVCRTAADGGSVEEKWVQFGDAGNISIVTCDGADNLRIAAAAAGERATLATENGITVLRYVCDGTDFSVTHTLTSNPEDIPQKIATSFYASLVRRRFVTSYDAAEFETRILPSVPPEMRDVVRDAYSEFESSYTIICDLTQENFNALTEILRAPPPSIFPATDFESLVTELSPPERAMVAGCYELSETFSLDPDLSEGQIIALASALDAGRIISSPYAGDRSDAYQTLKVGALKEARALLSDPACPVPVFSSVLSRITIREDGLFSVEEGDPAPGTAELPVSDPTFERAPGAAGTSYALVPRLGSGGLITKHRVYLHLFDSKHDFSLANLTPPPFEPVAVPEDAGELSATLGSFGGGVYGWYYGEWNGDLPWDVTRIVARRDASLAVEPGNRGKAVADWCAAMKAVPVAGLDSAAIDGGAGEGLTENHYGADAWEGTATSYGIRTVVDDEIHDSTACYAPYITADKMVPSRVGGDRISGVVDRSSVALGGINLIQSGQSSFTSWSAGIGPVSGTIGEGNSYSVADVVDMNGDHYPDRIFAESGGRIRVFPNRGGRGFTDGVAVDGLWGRLSVHRNRVLGLGVSMSPAKTVRVELAPGGEICNSHQDNAAGPGGSINATVGRTETVVDLFDINGDGLPDHVRRDGEAAYQVRLNTGSGGMSPPVTFPVAHTDEDSVNGLLNLSGNTQAIRCSFNVSGGGNFSFGAGGFGVNVSVSATANRTVADIIDMNGDDLPDRLFKDPGNRSSFLVQFNYGDTFGPPVTWNTCPWAGAPVDDSLRRAFDQLAGEIIGRNGHTGGRSGSLDFTAAAGLIEAATGSAADSLLQLGGPGDVIGYAGGASVSGGITIRIPIPVFTFLFVTISIYIAPGVSFGYGRTSTGMMIADIDGDGLPDHLFHPGGSVEGAIYYKPNRMQKVGLLQRVETPRGGTIALDYDFTRHSDGVPFTRSVMSSLTRSDGSLSTGSYTTTFRYDGGRFDRSAHEFLGFRAVTAFNTDGTRRVRAYLNDGPGVSGLLETEEQIDRTGAVRIRTVHSYALAPLVPVTFRQPWKSTVTRTDQSGNASTNSICYDYDQYGNVIVVDDSGSVDDLTDDLRVLIAYKAADDRVYLTNRPVLLIATDAGGTVLRERSAVYDDAGNVTQVAMREIASGRDAATSYEYDRYGNMTRVAGPDGYTVRYLYDDEVHTFPVSITDSFGCCSTAIYDPRFGVPVGETDIDGSSVRRAYDRWGRLISVWTDYDDYPTGTPAVRFDYHSGEYPQRAVSFNKMSFDPADQRTLRTVVITDGLGRVIQAKRDGACYDPQTGETTEGMNVTGSLVYDPMGRVFQEGQPHFESGAHVLEYQGDPEPVYPTMTTYDDLGRCVRTTFPDGSGIDTTYRIEGPSSVTRTTDPEGKVQEQYRDARSRVVREGRYLDGGRIDTGYTYNALGEMLVVTDAQGNRMVAEYDSLGRRTGLETPDGGHIVYTYDLAGNLTKKVDEKLRSRAEALVYRYDRNRLTEIVYPDGTTTSYSYGTPGQPGAGRAVRVCGPSGSRSCTYAPFGNVAGLSWTIGRLESTSGDYSAAFRYTWDYLGRMNNVTYPNGEKLTYRFDFGGRVSGVVSELSGNTFEYVKHIGYDSFGRRNSLTYGNDVTTTYAYEPERQWLESIRTVAPGGAVFQNKAYVLNLVGNIIRVSDSASRIDSTQSYGYDDLHRLVSAEGTITDTESAVYRPTTSYQQTFTYDELHRLTRRTSTLLRMPEHAYPAELNYDSAYVYGFDHPHQPTRIGGWLYEFDANGNTNSIIYAKELSRTGLPSSPISDPLAAVPDGVSYAREAYGRHRRDSSGTSGAGSSEVADGKGTRYTWDAENRLMGVEAAGNIVNFRYDEAGNRLLKRSEGSETLYAGTMWQMSRNPVGDTATMHIYVGESRVASKLTRPGTTDASELYYQQSNTFYYHTDHLGSSNVITDRNGDEYTRYQYTPTGEMWWERGTDQLSKVIHKFSGKELDPETGLYYYGARYLNPVNGLWLSTDPAINDYLDGASAGGGIFNPVNLVAYQFAGNNPLAFVDPDGAASEPAAIVVGRRYSAGRQTDVVATSILNDSVLMELRGSSLAAAQNAAMNAPNYQQGIGGWYPEATNEMTTYCNLALFGIARSLGLDVSMYAADENNTSAAGVVDRMQEMAGKGRLLNVDGRLAQALADRGIMVVAGWKSSTGANAHVATVARGLYSAQYGPQVANIGIGNGTKPAFAAFGVYRQDELHPNTSSDIRYFVDPRQFYDVTQKLNLDEITRGPNQ